MDKLANLQITGDAKLDAWIRYGIVALTMTISGAVVQWLKAHGFDSTHLIEGVPVVVGGLVVSGTLALWGAVKTSKNEDIIKIREAIAAQATLNMVAAGELKVDSAGKPCPVTQASVQQILDNHAPAAIPPKG